MSKITIIAEAGVNHNGKLKSALKLVKLASKAGADYVKFQTFNPDALTTKNLGLADYQKKNEKKITHFKLLDNLKLSEKDLKKIIENCKKNKIKFLSSPFDLESIILLKKLKLKIFKIPSGEITNIPYLRLLGSFNKKIILSTGMSTFKEVTEALKILTKSGTKKKNITLLHCNTQYPADIKNLNLLSIKYIKDKTKMNVGFSDHSLGNEASLISLAYGATIFEKHFTLNKSAKGPDHKASLSPSELFNYVKKLREFSKSIGVYEKKPYKEELKISKIARKQIVASRPINKGEKFSQKNITTKRAKKGIAANNWDKVIGRVAKFDFFINQSIKI